MCRQKLATNRDAEFLERYQISVIANHYNADEKKTILRLEGNVQQLGNIVSQEQGARVCNLSGNSQRYSRTPIKRPRLLGDRESKSL